MSSTLLQASTNRMSVFALVDCNNFFASCEMVFDPKLTGKPIVVLSSNDGCVIARSNEAKALGIKMGVPYFQVKGLIETRGVKVFSSNFVLYSDMSARVMSVLAESVPDMELYSIDEAFLLLDGFPDATGFAKSLRNKVGQWTGIPVSIGIGPTKTIAKLANHIAKKYMKSGVLSLMDPAMRERAYRKFKIEEVWGIGYRSLKRLNAMGVFSIQDFVALDPFLLRKRFSVTLLKTQNELKGEACLSLEDVRPSPKSISSSRSFGRKVTELDDLRAAVTLHVSKIAQKLRQKNLAARHLYVYAYGNRFTQTGAPWHFACTVTLPCPSNSTGPLLKIALQGIESIYQPGAGYKKVGVLAPEIFPAGLYTQDLFAPAENPIHSKISQAMDHINERFGSNQIFMGSLGTQRDWLPQHHLRSPHYTTSLEEVLRVV